MGCPARAIADNFSAGAQPTAAFVGVLLRAANDNGAPAAKPLVDRTAENQIPTTTQTSDAAIPPPPGAFSESAVYNTNSLNQLAQQNAAAWSWDLDGDLLSDTFHTYTWDAESRLASISFPAVPGVGTTYTYDGLGRRTSIARTFTAGGTAFTTNYIWCGAKLCQARNSNGSLTGYYAEGEYLSGSPAKSYYYAPDNIGSVRRVFAKSQSPTYDYDAYGVPLQTTPALTDFGYAGMFDEFQSGLSLAANRSYDPVAGRFQTRDPLGENADPEGNLYPYAANDPVNLNDPLGLCPEPSLSLSGLAAAVGLEIAGNVAIAAEVILTDGAAAAAVAPEEAALEVAAGGGEAADSGGLVNLAGPERTAHILTGDANGGGHMFPGAPGKTVFPQGWSGAQIMNHVSDVATDPSLKWLPQTGNGGLFTKAGIPARFSVTGIRDGVTLKVILEPAGEGIITAFPQ